MSEVRLHLGDCLDVLRTIEDESVDAVVTSPPYAEQRSKQYGGVPESDYPAWAVGWMREVRRVLHPLGSALINIREHVRGGQISDYVHRTRLALRVDGWLEPDELIWIKPNGMPVGRVDRPRRSWERILWFAKSRDCRCYPKANGHPSRSIGLTGSSRNADAWIHGADSQSIKGEGIARSPDWISISPRLNPNDDWLHPAAYPLELATWMLGLVTPSSSTVLDPFMGSGTTGLAALKQGRSFIGIEKKPEHFEVASRRIGDALNPTRDASRSAGSSASPRPTSVASR